ncbi:type III pantothenate kinase [Oscillospiraceae bacterium OttesenSCG-928-F05]|nr:type III pantothenate kinase [Oscillospiraceae bacterium OttesenSCG-928-F05]
MILTIDVGNTNITLGLYSEAGEFYFLSRLATDKKATGDQYAALIHAIVTLNGRDPGSITGSIVSSVVPQIRSALVQALKLLTGEEPLVVGPGLKTGLNILIEDPAELGADLVVDAVMALKRYTPPIILVDVGTATKVSAIDKKGSYLGCAIMPGIRIGGEALSSSAALLTHISLDDTFRAIGRNSADSMRSGLLYGHADMVSGMVRRYEKELGPSTVVLTGGDAHLIRPYIDCALHHDANLLMDGLYYLYTKNSKTAKKF